LGIRTSTRLGRRKNMLHHWVEGNRQGKCSKCKIQIKGYNEITGLHALQVVSPNGKEEQN
jgi:hypothetical protein